MVFNILVGMAWNGRKEVRMCVCVRERETEKDRGWWVRGGKVKMSNCL